MVPRRTGLRRQKQYRRPPEWPSEDKCTQAQAQRAQAEENSKGAKADLAPFVIG